MRLGLGLGCALGRGSIVARRVTRGLLSNGTGGGVVTGVEILEEVADRLVVTVEFHVAVPAAYVQVAQAVLEQLAVDHEFFVAAEKPDGSGLENTGGLDVSQTLRCSSWTFQWQSEDRTLRRMTS